MNILPVGDDSFRAPSPVVMTPQRFEDERGWFFESFHLQRYDTLAIPGADGQFVQDNVSRSRRGVVRGLHYQLERPQGKLVTCLRGRILDVVVDLRRSSSSCGRWLAVELSEENGKQLYVPVGFAHGFCALEESDVLYKTTDFYDAASERTLLWNDQTIGVTWPVASEEAIVSAKDSQGKAFSAIELFP
jgi:dTDP-4-dehydrorhamnose 3,5-epimerase